MYPESSPLIITRKLKINPEGEINCHYELGKMMHNGLTTSIHEVRQLFHPLRPKDNGKKYLIRITQKEETQEAQLQQSRDIMRQYSLLKSLNESHPSEHFLKQQAAWEDQKHFYQLFQHCFFCSLEQLLQYRIKQKRPFKAMHILYFVREILKMLSMLHQSKIIHGNVRDINLWLDGRMNVKLGGFETASKDGDIKTGIRCNAYQIPLEILNKNNKSQYSCKSDIWMLGILAYRMRMLRFPFTFDEKQKDAKAQQKKITIQTRINRSSYPFSFVQDAADHGYRQLKDIITKMLNKSSYSRLSASDLLKQKIFQQVQQQSMQIKKDIVTENIIFFKNIQIQKTSWRFQIAASTNGKLAQGRLEMRKIRIVEALRIQKYGFFFRLSNKSMIAYFNDHKVLEANKEWQLNRSSQYYDDNQKFKIMRYVYQNYFKNHLWQQIIDMQLAQTQQNQDCSISKLFWHQKTLWVRLTNQTIQVFTNTNQHNNSSSSSPQYFDYYLIFNNSPSKPNQIVLHKNNRFFTYQSYQEIKQNPQSQEFFGHVDKCIKLILENSAISKEKCQQGFKKQC